MPENIIPPLNLAEPEGTPVLVLDPPTPTPTQSSLPSEPIVSPVQSPVASVRKFPFLLTLVLIFLSVAAAIGIYLLVQVRTMALDKIAPSPTPILDPTPEPDPTADWITYSDTKNRFTFRYPENRQIVSSLEKVPENSIYVEVENLNFSSTVKQRDMDVTKLTNVDIISRPNEFFRKGSFDSNYSGLIAFFPLYKNETLVISQAITGSLVDQKSNEEFDQILATLELEESPPSTNPSYTCPKSEWVDCMPSPDAGVKLECTPEFLTWARSSCPGFKGGAL